MSKEVKIAKWWPEGVEHVTSEIEMRQFMVVLKCAKSTCDGVMSATDRRFPFQGKAAFVHVCGRCQDEFIVKDGRRYPNMITRGVSDGKTAMENTPAEG